MAHILNDSKYLMRKVKKNGHAKAANFIAYKHTAETADVVSKFLKSLGQLMN